MHIGLYFKTGITYRICARSVLKRIYVMVDVAN